MTPPADDRSDPAQVVPSMFLTITLDDLEPSPSGWRAARLEVDPPTGWRPYARCDDRTCTRCWPDPPAGGG